MAAPMKFAIALLALVSFGMIFGALLQLEFIGGIEESDGKSFPSFKRVHKSRNDGSIRPHGGISLWENDMDAKILRIGFVKPEILSWSPRIILLHNFLSSEECDYLRALAKPLLQISTVVDSKTGKGIQSDVRTSSGMFLSPDDSTYPIVRAIEKRISVYSQVPIENGELIQVLRYKKSQFYKPHHDYFSDSFNLKRGGQRVATMLMYLSDNVEGGETYFPMAASSFCQCGGKNVRGLSVAPVKGNAVLFWSMKHKRSFLLIKHQGHDVLTQWANLDQDKGLDGQSDPNSIHGGCEVLGGEKWSATKWMRQRTTH